MRRRLVRNVRWIFRLHHVHGAHSGTDPGAYTGAYPGRWFGVLQGHERGPRDDQYADKQ